MKKFYLLLLLALPMACTTTNEENTSLLPYNSGEWLLNFEVKDIVIPIHISLGEDSVMTIHNGQEQIQAPLMIQGDSVYIELPHYQTYLTGSITSAESIRGHWHNTQKGADYLIPFYAQSNHAHSDFSSQDISKYEVHFSPNTEDEYPALALFSLNEHATGTFLTETGDYRYLAGHFIDQQLQLSCFDGSHLFHFEAEMQEDSLVNGLFYSGKHWEEPWIGIKNEQFELAHPDSLTRALQPKAPFELNLMSTDGDFIHMDSTSFQGKVSIVQVLGTWCPNCLDESKYYKELYSKYADQGLQIIPVAFERSDNFETSSITVQRYFKDLGIDYPAYIGGQANKQNASNAFPMLSPIISYPTSIYIDKTGRVCKVHTGFYGPSTGAYYQRYTQTTDEFIREQLNL